MRNGRGRSSGWRGAARAALALAAVLVPRAGRCEDAASQALARGAVELSTGLSLSHQAAQGDSYTLLNVPVRVGALLDSRFELEGELLLTFTRVGFGDLSSSETGLTGAVHGLYHFRTGSNTVPFLLLGAGYGNATSVENVAMTGSVWLLRVGAGVKSFFGRHAALRAEYRFTRSSGDSKGECNIPQGCETISSGATINEHAVLVGISLWF
jgi:opacity protein-like surface antigen